MAHTRERAVAGVTHGLIGAGQSVTFEAVHFGFCQRLSATVVRFDPPRLFADEMTQGAFAALRHTHEFFARSATQTVMRDTLEWKSPLGPLGRFANALFLKRYMTNLIRGRGARLKQATETPIVPGLEPDFSHAAVDDILIGPRRELTLVLRPLIWAGNKGRHGEPMRVRFGGIVNFEAVQAFFADAPHSRSELAWLRCDETMPSKPGQLFFDLVFERIDARISISCGSLTIDGALVSLS